MKKSVSAFLIAIGILMSTQLLAKGHGFVNSIYEDIPKENIFRVNIEKIDGRDARSSYNKELKAGERSIEDSLVFNPVWGTGMSMTDNDIYYQTISLDVEAGKTYTLGAKVNTHATSAEQKDGSFWETIIYKTH